MPPRTDELKVYRPPFLSTAFGLACDAVFFIIALSMVTIGSGQRDPALNVVSGVLLLLGCLWLGAALLANRVIVTPAGVVVSKFLRRRVLSWAEVESFGVGRTRAGMIRYPNLVIRRNDGSVLDTNLAGFTGRYPARIAEELTAWKHRVAPAERGQLT